MCAPSIQSICRFLPTKKNRMSWGLDREIRRGLVQLIGRRSDAAEEHETEIKDKGNSGGFRDLLGLMINARDKKSQPMPVEDMVEECKTFFFAGKQTTTNLLTWATVLLAMHPDWQDRGRQEVLAVCGLGELPTKEHLHKLKTVRHPHITVPKPKVLRKNDLSDKTSGGYSGNFTTAKKDSRCFFSVSCSSWG